MVDMDVAIKLKTKYHIHESKSFFVYETLSNYQDEVEIEIFILENLIAEVPFMLNACVLIGISNQSNATKKNFKVKQKFQIIREGIWHGWQYHQLARL